MRGDVECMSRGEICVTIFLVINTWTDIRKREICLPVLGLFLAGGILWRIIEGTLYPQGLIAMGIGGAATIISVMSRGGVGAGDSLLILAMGTVLNAGTLMGILCMAMLLSFTIEAALLMPLILLILMGLLYLNFFVHNRAWLTAAAYEAAVSGSMEGYSKNGNVYEKADMQGRMLGSTGLPGGENLSIYTSAGKNVQVTYRMEIPAGFLGLTWNIKVTGKAVCLRPVGWIRKIKSARETVEEVTLK